ncbi:hypothetical protein [Streptomyces yaizuensis]|uniref:Uncharacterized protein n=1 Tax=Streptomyces yaizuensis TaxID=2989713 RepID=A0ABQ5NSN5_9ACTN|nr:hypothetical protein [Streptomyces sp. YSPA8]GLF93370.1 hypothetical protein SYYSPA8_03755 [Streptomyces sp. YSPA8]
MSPPGTAADGAVISVGRCVVTVVRCGGWSWGPAPRGLVDRVVEALPELLAERFAAELAGDGPDVEITEPVTVTVRAAGGGTVPGAPAAFDADFGSLPLAPVPAVVPDDPEVWSAGSPSTAVPWSPPGPAALFAELAERDELDALPALLPRDSVRVWLGALLAPGGDGDAAGRLLAELARRSGTGGAAAGGGVVPSGGAGDEDGPVARCVRALTRQGSGDVDGVAAALAAVVAADGPQAAARLLGRAAARFADGPLVRLCSALTAAVGGQDVLRLADALPGSPGEQGAPAGPRPGDAAADSRTTGDAAPPPTKAQVPDAPRVSRTAGEVRVWSALPFLLAGPLARIGYLDAIGPTLAAAEAADEAPLFAAALAYKVLGRTARGWRREERDRTAAAAFAGLGGPPSDESLTGFARRAGPALPALDAVLALAVCRGHDRAEPLLLTAVGGGLLLVDAQGLFPIAWTRGAAGLLPHWRACGTPPVLVCGGAPATGELGVLVAAGVPLLTAVPPLRGEPLLRVGWRTPLWASPGAPPDPRLARALPGHGDRLAELVGEVAEGRRAVPLDPCGRLERAVTLAALLGLGTIAWTLWREREVPDPVSALRRFADLDAAVRFGPDTVRVRIPLGARHTDLLRHGLLADVRDVVWLGGRTLTFGGG